MVSNTDLRCNRILLAFFLVVSGSSPVVGQGSLSKNSVVQVDNAVVLNPANVSTRVRAPSVKLRGRATYQVKVAFNFDKNLSEEQKKLLFLRVQLYTKSASAKSNGSNAWTLIQRFSSGGSIRNNTFPLSRDSQWLITYWYADKNRRGGIADCGTSPCLAVDEFKEGKGTGIKFTFKSPSGSADVTIAPV